MVLFAQLVLDSTASPAKKARNELSREVKQWIGDDDGNKKIWDELLATQDTSVSVCVHVWVCCAL